MPSRRRAELVLAFPNHGQRQADFETPIDEDVIIKAWAMTSDSYPGIDREIDRILNCTLERLTAKELLRRIMRFNFDFEASGQLIAQILAYKMGVAAAPTGTQANQIQRFTRTATGGTWRVGIPVGQYTKYTPFLAWNISAANLKAAIENLVAIGRGNTTVTLTPAVVAAFATAQLTTTDIGTIGQTLSIGGKVYTISVDGLGVDEIEVGVDAADFAANIAARVNTDTATTLCTAVPTGAVVVFTANTIGAGGNSITFSTTDPDITINNVFTGGVTGVNAFWEVTHVNNLARAQMAQYVVDVSLLTGGTVTPSQTQAGVQKSHALSEITTFQQPVFGFVVGYRNSARLPRRYDSVVVDSLRISGAHAQPRLAANVLLIGSGNLNDVTSGYVIPACTIYRPIRFKDCLLTIDGVDYSNQPVTGNPWRDFDLTMSSNTITDDDAYPGQDEDVHRLERADERPWSLNVGILGEKGDDIYALAEENAEVPVTLQLGRSNEAIIFTVPKASVSLRNPETAFDGTAKRTKIQINIEPEEIPGDATTPYTVTAKFDESNTLLAVA